MSEENKGREREARGSAEETSAERENARTEELAADRGAKPGPGARDETASQVDAANPNEESDNLTLSNPSVTESNDKVREHIAEQDQAAAENVEKTKASTGKAAQEGKAPLSAEEKAAKAAAAKAGKAAKEEKPKEPSPKQPYLDRVVGILREALGEEAVEDAFVNELSRHLPTLVVKKERWLEVARILREDERLAFDLLLDVVGVDYLKYMEVVYQLTSLTHNELLSVKVKTEREEAEVPSVTSVWLGANWPERETYDLLGIRFSGHPDLRRIMLPEEWVGHPLRKDYEPYDVEV